MLDTARYMVGVTARYMLGTAGYVGLDLDLGGQEMLMLVCLSVPSLSRAVNLHHSGSNLQAISPE